MVGFLVACAIGFQFDSGRTSLNELVQWDVVQRELSLTPDQRRDANAGLRLFYNVLEQEPSPIDKPIEFVCGTGREFLTTFSRAQILRIAQLQLQCDGIKAIDDTSLARKLGLTSTQMAAVQRLLHPPQQEPASFVKVTFSTPLPPIKIKGRTIDINIVGEPERTIAEKIAFYDQNRLGGLQWLEDEMATRRSLRKLLTPAQSQQLAKMKGQPMASAMRDLEAHVLGSRFHPELLTNKDVQQELTLTPAQIQKIDQSPTFWFTSDDLPKVLNPNQVRRFQELDLQADGPFALLRHDVAHRLQIDEGMIDQMTVRLERVYVDCYREADRAWLALDHGGKAEEIVQQRQKVFEKYEAAARQVLLACLTPWQQTQWHKLTGKPLVTMATRYHLGQRPVQYY